MKNILVHVQDDGRTDQLLESALSLCRAVNGHLDCVQYLPADKFVAFDGFGGVYLIEQLLKDATEAATAIQARIEQKLSHEDVSWQFETINAHATPSIVARSAFTDVIIASRARPRLDQTASPVGFLGDILHQSRTPLMVPGDDGVPYDPARPAIIAWDGSIEAAYAVRGTLDLLKLASDVIVVRVEEKAEGLPDTTIMQYLSRHGVHAEMDVVDYRESWVQEILIARAKARGSATLVMGGYSHRRFGELLFGGATQSILSACDATVILAH